MAFDRNPNNSQRFQRAFQRLATGGFDTDILTAVQGFSVDGETPTGAIDGSNASFQLLFLPDLDSVKVYINGLRQLLGGSNDYTVSGQTVVFTTPPKTGDHIQIDYLKASV